MRLEELETVLRDRRDNPPASGSYSVTLLTDREQAQRKIMEEAFELCLELGRAVPDQQRVAAEAGDVLYHVLVGLVGVDVPLQAVMDELATRRAGLSGAGES